MTAAPPCQSARERLRVRVRGAVQGVGFRPFVYRLARDLDLAGWVVNSGSGVIVEVEGAPDRAREFLVRLDRERPARSVVQGTETSWLDPVGYDGFEIRASVDDSKQTLVLPDIATCPDCLAEIRDGSNRRFRYPFTNCTHCGPRFSIVTALPYDRARTTMAGFRMCDACRAEYEDPSNRRFHAQPTACPECGPHLELWDMSGRPAARADDALRSAEARIRSGEVVALKGLGGFQLIADARRDEAVRRLRLAKAREEKPFALMVPSLVAARRLCRVGDLEERLLLSPEAPIVLLERLGDRADVADSVAPGNPALGVMLPYTPLHHLLLEDLGFPVVATSGNVADEPICIDEREALNRLAGMADAMLVHDRPIARHVDDSVVRVVLDRELLLRRARGYAPLPVRIAGGDAEPVLGVGAHLKNTVALSVGPNVFVSQHIGDLETAQAYRAFEDAIGALEGLYETRPATIACDEHPGYLSTAFARQAGPPVIEVQHHLAHVIACMAENEIDGPVLGVAWDGTGYGPDGTIWGGEFFEVDDRGARRAAALRTFALPGGEQAIKEPRRSALGLLHEVGETSAASAALGSAFTDEERIVLVRMLARGVNSPRTSSAGRLFDALASLAGLGQRSRYEGQAAMAVEYAASASGERGAYPLPVLDAPSGDGSEPPAARARLVVDWEPMFRAALDDLRAGSSPGVVCARFHHGLADAIVAVAQRVGHPRVVLSGGCFQNRYLTESTVERLRRAGFRPYWHQRIPPNDGGIALGQVVAAKRGFGRPAARRTEVETGGVYVPGGAGTNREHQR